MTVKAKEDKGLGRGTIEVVLHEKDGKTGLPTGKQLVCDAKDGEELEKFWNKYGHTNKKHKKN